MVRSMTALNKFGRIVIMTSFVGHSAEKGSPNSLGFCELAAGFRSGDSRSIATLGRQRINAEWREL